MLAAAAASVLLLFCASSATAATFTVTTGADTLDPGTLRTAINDAESNGNEPTVDLIQFDPSVTAVDLQGFLPQITTPMTIDGPGAGSLNIRRDSGAVTAFGFFVVDPASPAYTITIRGLTMSGVVSTSFSGGAVQMNGPGSLVLDSIVLTGGTGTTGVGLTYSEGSTSIMNSALTNNTSTDEGAAIAGTGGEAQLVNTTVDGNHSDRFGGGVYTGNDAEIQILSSTITRNEADSDANHSGDGGGVYNSSTGSFEIANTLLAGNFLGDDDGDTQCSGNAFTSSGYNLRSDADTAQVDTSGCNGFGATGDFVSGTPLIAGAPATNGGSTPNVALLPGSPAIEAGNPAPFGTFPTCPATDQRSLFRGGVAGRCDIGSYELNATATPPSGGGGTTSPPATTSTTTGQRAKAIKKCKKKFRHKPAKRKKCIKKAKKLPA